MITISLFLFFIILFHLIQVMVHNGSFSFNNSNIYKLYINKLSSYLIKPLSYHETLTILRTQTFISSIVFFSTLYCLSLKSALVASPCLIIFGNFILIEHLRLKQKKILIEIDLNFPYFLDLISSAVHTGLDFFSSLNLVLPLLDDTELKVAFTKLKQLNTVHASKEKLFHVFSKNIPSENIQKLCHILVQSHQAGSSIHKNLKQFSHDVQQNQFFLAEKEIQKIPVKLLAPLMLCIFPVTFIIIFVPVLLSFN